MQGTGAARRLDSSAVLLEYFSTGDFAPKL